MLTEIGQELVRGLETLSQREQFRSVLAENVLYSGGYELLVQRGFLWAFNTMGRQKYWLTIEKLVGNSCKGELDLIVLENTPEYNRLVAGENGLDRDQHLMLGKAFVEMKHVDSRGKIKNDLHKLRLIRAEASRNGLPKKETYELIVFGEYDSPMLDDAEYLRRIERNEVTALEMIASFLEGDEFIEETQSVWLIRGELNPSNQVSKVFVRHMLVKLGDRLP